MPKPNRPQTCHGAVKEPMRNARTATGFEPTPSKMPLCEASESLERQQASCPRHAKHKPEKRQPKTVRSQPFHMVPKLLATDPKRPNATTGRAQASQKHKPEKMLPVTFGIHKTFLVASTLAARLGPKPVYRNAKCRGGAEFKVVPKPNRPQTCHGAVKEPMRNARTAAGFEPTPSKMPLCEASESLEQQQKPVPKHLVFSFVFGSLKTCFRFFGNTCFFDFWARF